MALISIATIVDTHLPHLAKPISDEDKCVDCAHLIHRPGRSICREAKMAGDWPALKRDGTAITRCDAFLPQQGANTN